ncbi:uncharacterized protein SCHCODRAFT_02689460 [Schizophyllum commune H4-8]|nr:uncharacterized protein SCHCODRAFT_02689460 [Schizophyllum commune H4-8]KAI5891229.1 hypothetical protein SCHCODRAFT_02689460 [Schizophyllum commune H4-8]
MISTSFLQNYLASLTSPEAKADPHTLFLGEPNAELLAQWVLNGHDAQEHVVVPCPLPESDLPARHYPLPDQHSSSPAAKKSASGGASSTSHDDTASIPWDPEPMTNILIGTVNRRNCFLSPDGGYKGSTEYTPSLSKMKMSFTLSPTHDPEHGVLQRASQLSFENLDMLQASCPITKDRPCRGGYDSLQDEVKFRHVPFEKLDQDPETGEMIPEPPRPASEACFTLEGWPVETSAARQELADLVKTHSYKVVPLPAYGADGHLIRPTLYRAALVGALVEVRFTLRHHYIGRYNNFTADVISINIISPPSTNSLKRKFVPSTSFDTPAKRARRYEDSKGHESHSQSNKGADSESHRGGHAVAA